MRRTGTTPLRGAALLAAVLLTLLTGCGDDEPAADDGVGDTGTVDPQGTYVADSIDSGTHTLVDGTTIRVTFEDGQMSLQAGCNTMSGTVSVDGDTLVVDNLAGTEMGCDEPRMQQDQWLSEFLTGSPQLALEDDAFSVSSGDTTIRFGREAKAQDVPLVNTAWKLDAVTTGSGPDSAVSSVPADAHNPMVQFRNGVAGFDVSFSTGCNQGRGPVEIGSEVMDFGALAMTRMACADAVGQLEQTFLGVLGKGTTYKVDGDQLTLTAADGGSGLMFRAG